MNYDELKYEFKNEIFFLCENWSYFLEKSQLNEKEQENISLKNELNLMRDQMPTSASDDDDIVMKAVEERVKQWKVRAYS